MGPTQSIEIGTFSIDGGRFCRILFGRHLKRYWWCYALPLLVCLLLALLDVRFLLVALMMVFIMFPMAVFLIYIIYGFDMTNRYNVMRKSAIADSEGITLTIDPDYNLKSPCISVPWHSVVGRRVGAKCLVLMLEPAHGNRFLAIPLDSFLGEQHLRDFISLINPNNTLKS